MVVVIQHLAVQALDAFVGIDVPFGMDGLHRALVAAALARVAAFAVTPEPVEHAQARRNRERRAERAQITAEYRSTSGSPPAARRHTARTASSRTKRRMIAVLNGSTSAACSAVASALERDAEQHQKDDVFQRDRRWCTPNGICSCGIFRAAAERG